MAQPLNAEQLHEVAEEQSDRNQTREFRIFGPPGTGKTTTLSRQVSRAVNKFGDSSVLVTSFSKTAAAELAGRGLPIPPDKIGTLHSHCYRALGAPELAEANVEEWNQQYQHWAISPTRKQGKLDGDESGAEGESTISTKDGDALIEECSRWRGMMVPEAAWAPDLQTFYKHWCAYKRDNGYLDFTDLIEVAYTDTWAAPGSPAVIFADEAQDLNRLQLSLIRRWGERSRYFIVAGDDDQLLYGWCGCTTEALLDPPIPEENIIILKQSYRVPRAVHAKATRWITQVSRRQEKEYLPRDFPGLVEHPGTGDWKDPRSVLDIAMRLAEDGKRVMFLTACAYQLQPLVKMLRQEGVPFHNPYRRSNGFWNPIRTGKRASSANRLLALLVAHPEYGPSSRPWTVADLSLWIDWLVAKGLVKHGAKKRLQAINDTTVVDMPMLVETFEEATLESLLDQFDGSICDLAAWWKTRLNGSVQDRADFPVRVAMKTGSIGLLEEPRITVGTIHSVKGGEADAVFLWPDISAAGAKQYQSAGAPRDSIIRQFYVGMTRAKESLYICPQCGPSAEIRRM